MKKAFEDSHKCGGRTDGYGGFTCVLCGKYTSRTEHEEQTVDDVREAFEKWAFENNGKDGNPASPYTNREISMWKIGHQASQQTRLGEDVEQGAKDIIESIWDIWYGKHRGNMDSDSFAGVLEGAKHAIISLATYAALQPRQVDALQRIREIVTCADGWEDGETFYKSVVEEIREELAESGPPDTDTTYSNGFNVEYIPQAKAGDKLPPSQADIDEAVGDMARAISPSMFGIGLCDNVCPKGQDIARGLAGAALSALMALGWRK